MLWGRKHTKKLSRVHTALPSNAGSAVGITGVKVHAAAGVYTLYKLKYKSMGNNFFASEWSYV